MSNKILKNYTQTEWRAVFHKRTLEWVVRDEDGLILKMNKVFERSGTRGEGSTEANAKLIAAAPKTSNALIEALNLLQDWKERLTDGDHAGTLVKDIEDVVAKSESALTKAGILQD